MSGYGVMTRGVIPHLARQDDISVALLSRHLSEPPCEGVELTTLDAMVSTPPDVIIGCFETDERSREFWLDRRVGQAVAERGAGCIEMSTLSLGWARDWHGAVSAAGGISVESPVTGSRPGATSGTLSAFVYESAHDPRVRRVLDCFVSKRYDFHLPGNPTCFKLVYNAWGASLLHSVAAYVPTLQDRLGKDFDVAQEILSSDGWMALVCASKLSRVVAADFDDPDFAVRHMVKDLGYARDMVGTPHALLDLVHQSFRTAAATFGGDADYTAVAGGASA
ncbi:NAD-binding protein [Streptomyces sp. NPDC006465]|uniref:NAD-binding protein n=1 Tax=Streptomyces sp. NPDC006465 TaxID=3157174 RepID=UPI0033B84201